MDNIDVNFKFKDFSNFLMEAKKKTYAGNGQKIKMNDHSRHYNYEKKPFRYHDIYYGNIVDGGGEIVYFEDKPIWWMGYHGGVSKNSEKSIKEIYDFLKEALLLVPEKFPVRGPEIYSKINFLYLNSHIGDIRRFFGEELIKNNNEKVYFRNYVGGFIVDKEYNLVFLDDREDL